MAAISEYHFTIAASHYFAGCRTWHNWHPASLGSSLPGDQGGAVRHIPHTCLYYFPGGVRVAGTHPDGLCLGAGVYPGGVDLLLYLFATAFHLERNAVVLGGSHGRKS